jgi:tryptophan 2,3-dioxygenase
MENTYDTKAFTTLMNSGMDMFTRYHETARTMTEAQIAAAHKNSIEAVNRAFELVRECWTVTDTMTKTGMDNLRKFSEGVQH